MWGFYNIQLHRIKHLPWNVTMSDILEADKDLRDMMLALWSFQSSLKASQTLSLILHAQEKESCYG